MIGVKGIVQHNAYEQSIFQITKKIDMNLRFACYDVVLHPLDDIFKSQWSDVLEETMKKYEI